MPEPISTGSLIACHNGKPCPLNEDIIELKEEVKSLSRLVSTDTLTGLHNYRFFSQSIIQEMERSQRTGQSTTLMIIDADYFKKVNDQWGHEAGNQALKLLANCIKDNIRKLDIACRYGGEEFTVILPSTDIATSVQVAERIRTAVEEAPLFYEENTIALTVSIGISTYKGNNPNDERNKLIERADSELYRAKQQGRNQVCYPSIEHVKQQVSQDEKTALFDMFNSKDNGPE